MTLLVASPIASAIVGTISCGGHSADVSCGSGTHLSGSTCVASVGDAGGTTKADAGLTDAGRDAQSTSPDARLMDALATHEAATDATTGVKDATGTADATALGDGEASVPEPCADVNGCVAFFETTGPVDLGTYDSCNGTDMPAYTCATSGPFGPPCGTTGSQSQWFTLQYVDSCPVIGLVATVYSQPSALFDIEVYEVPASEAGAPPSACPALVASSVASMPDCCAGPYASVDIKTTGELYVHVVAEATAQCATGAPWTLAFGPD